MTDPFLPPITEDDIANYLVNTPDFFDRHAGVLASVQLSSPHGQRAVSLQERQAGLLRDKIKGLELKAADMIRHGQENFTIADRLQRWTQELLRTAQARDLPGVLVGGVVKQFLVPQAAIKVWDVADAYADMGCTQGVSDDVKAFAASLVRPYCGGNPGLEAAGWLEEPQAVASLALIPLRDGGVQSTFGLLVLGSPDAQRFGADMGTEFLERMGALTGAALSRLR
jgi:uncharacterized protein YigA (DUF484 family)